MSHRAFEMQVRIYSFTLEIYLFFGELFYF